MVWIRLVWRGFAVRASLECPHLRIEIGGTRFLRSESDGCPIHAVLSHEWEFACSAKRLCPLRVDLDCLGLASCIVVEAAPAVVFGTGNESSRNRIAMDVLDLLDELPSSEGIEVVIAGLPELVPLAFQQFGGLPFDDS